MAVPTGTDNGGCPNLTSATQDEGINHNSALMCSSSEDITTDWIQWMRWDEIEDDTITSYPTDTFDNKEQPENKVDLGIPSTTTATTVPPSDLTSFPMPPFDFSFNGGMSPTHVRGSSNGSFQSQPLFSPTINGQSALESSELPSNPVTFGQGQSSLFTLSPSPVSPVSRKRKSSNEDSPATMGTTPQATPPAAKSLPSKKRSHNVIEKRYRANLNEKIAELRDSVPSLRIVYKQRHGDGSAQRGDEEDYPLSSNNKLNKASILSKATEYIKHLEVRNKRLEEENIGLKNRLRQLDKVQERNLMGYPSVAGSETSPGACTISTDSAGGSSPDVFSHTGDFSPESTPNPLYPPEGLIKVPEYFKRMRPSGPQPHYADSQQYQQPQVYDSPPPGNIGRGRFGGFPNKFMLGTLAGLMVVGGFESNRKAESSEKELLAVPLQYLGKLCDFARSHAHLIRATSWQIRALSQFAMTSVFVVSCAFFVFLYLFYSRPRSARASGKLRNRRSNAPGVLSSEFRREAWLTSIQTVGVPSHTFFPEWFAVTSRCLEYCLRCLLGWNLYSLLTGISEDDEKGRVKAWDIALDAQLTGGDAEVSKSRLVLTIFAAGTLPRSTARMMLKAFHCRILLWRVGASGSISFKISNYVAGILARYQWELARKMHENVPSDHEDALPSHLALLLAMDCEEVFADAIIQRSSNMIWNRATQEATDGEDSLLDVVAEDTSVRSPLDALASWWSSRALQEALLGSLDLISVEHPSEKLKAFEHKLDLALRSAPSTSTAYTRASAMKALFCDVDRVGNINSVLAALPSPKQQTSKCATNFLDSSVPPSARAEICIAVRCAMIAAILREQVGKGSNEPAGSQFSLSNAIELFNKLPVDEIELTLLGFASLYHLLHITATDERLFPCTSLSSSISSTSSEAVSIPSTSTGECENQTLPVPDRSRIASDLIYWVRNAYNPISSGVNAKLMEKVVEDCVDLCRNAGVHIDVKKIQQIKTHQRKPSVTFSENDEEIPIDKRESTGDDDTEKARGRRESLRSNDTGYGSLDSDAVKETEEIAKPKEILQNTESEGSDYVRKQSDPPSPLEGTTNPATCAT